MVLDVNINKMKCFIVFTNKCIFFKSIFTTDVIPATLIIQQSLYFWKKNTSDINSQLAVGRFDWKLLVI